MNIDNDPIAAFGSTIESSAKGLKLRPLSSFTISVLSVIEAKIWVCHP